MTFGRLIKNWTIFARSFGDGPAELGQFDATMEVNIDCEFAGVSKR